MTAQIPPVTLRGASEPPITWSGYWEEVLTLEAGCVTVSTTQDVQVLIAEFGSQAQDVVLDSEYLDDTNVDITLVPGGAMVCECLGLQGTRPVILNELSRGGRAASIYWSVNGDWQIAFSSRGVHQGRYVFGDPSAQKLPGPAQKFGAVFATAEVDLPRKAMAAVGAFTGVAMPDEPTSAPVRYLITQPKQA